MEQFIKRIRAPRAATFPILIEEVLVSAGQEIEKGTALYIIRDASGRRMKFRSPERGVIEDGPIPEGAAVGANMPIIGLRLTETQAARAEDRQATQNKATDGVWGEHEIPRPPGALQIVKFAFVFTGVALGLNLLAQVVVPDFDHELVLPVIIVAIVCGAIVAALLAKRWASPPSPSGYVLGVLSAASLSYVASIEIHSSLHELKLGDIGQQKSITDNTIESTRSSFDSAQNSPTDVWGQKFSELMSDTSTAKTSAQAQDRNVMSLTSEMREQYTPSYESEPSANPGTSSSFNAKPVATYSANIADDPQVFPQGCYIQLWSHCARPYNEDVEFALVTKFVGSGFPTELCQGDAKVSAYYPEGDFFSHAQMPEKFQSGMEERLIDFMQAVKEFHPDCRFEPGLPVNLAVRPAEEMEDEFDRTCWINPVPKNYNTPVCARF